MPYLSSARHAPRPWPTPSGSHMSAQSLANTSDWADRLAAPRSRRWSNELALSLSNRTTAPRWGGPRGTYPGAQVTGQCTGGPAVSRPGGGAQESVYPVKKPARPSVAVDLQLDGQKQLGGPLGLVDANQAASAGHEPNRVGSGGIQGQASSRLSHVPLHLALLRAA